MAYDVFDRNHEIIVAGSGLAGLAAAITAARAGRKVLLVSRRPNLGWEITSAWASRVAPGVSPLADEILARMAGLGAAADGCLAPPIAELLFDRMAEEAGVEVLLYAAPLAVARDENRNVCGLQVATKSGEKSLAADCVVDATDTRVLARSASLSMELRDDVAGRSTITMNLAEGDVADGRSLGDAGRATRITLERSPWPGEVFVTHELPTLSPADAQLAAPDVLRKVREMVPELRAALVTTMSVEPLPLAARVTGPSDGNALGAVARLLVAPAAADPSDAASLLASGEALGLRAAEAWTPGAPSGYVYASTVGWQESCDVLVAGGGTAGALAAIAAARQGVRVAVIEPLAYLGGIGTGGGIHSYYHGVNDDLQAEVDARVAELQPLFSGGREVTGFHPDAKKVALLELALKAGVRVVLGTTISAVHTEPVESADAPSETSSDVVRADQKGVRPPVRITSVTAGGPDGDASWSAKVFIDATGDGDLAAEAGAPFTLGREGDGLMHAYSQSAGHIATTKEGQPRLGVLNFDAGYVDPNDVTDMTRARRLGLQHLRRPRFTPGQRWTYIAPHLGLRQGRQILGDYELTLGDQIAGRRFPDVVAFCKAHYDNHAYDYENESEASAVWVWLLGQWRTPYGCEVPYRCLLPRGVEGLLVGCRAISITQDAHHMLRMQRDMQRLGIAAGVAAALAVKAGVTPRQVNVAELQAVLAQLGSFREADRPRAALPDRTSGELVADLATAAAPPAVWQLAFGHQDALPALREAAAAGPPAGRFWASVALAVARDKAAVPELLAAVRERREETVEGVKTQPKWQAAVVLLGRLGDKAAVPALMDVLADKSAPLHAVIAAVRALGKIGDAAAAPAVRKTLKRTDLSTARFLQFSSGNAMKTVEDARWQFDLACAEALARLGKPAPAVAKKYLTDDRAYVRRLARRVLEM
jgi:flavin-dependent dehydrogenase